MVSASRRLALVGIERELANRVGIFLPSFSATVKSRLETRSMFFPDKRIASRLLNERAGIWIADSTNAPNLVLVAKLPNNVVRDVHAGADVNLNVSVVQVGVVRVAVFGCAIFDDRVHPLMVSGACRSRMEIENLTALLRLGCVPIQFHNENGIPLLYADCSFEPATEDIVASLANIPATSDHLIRQEALDIAQECTEDQTRPDPRISTHCSVALGFSNHHVFDVHLPTMGAVSLDRADQGKELEILTLQLIDEVFSFGTYHSPQREHSKGMLEVCDILAVSGTRQVDCEGIFVIQNKVAIADGAIRPFRRRGSSVRKNIRKAIKQSVGAIRKIKSGTQIYKNDGTKIEVDHPEIGGVVEPLQLAARAQEVGYGIILVSYLHEGVDWGEVFIELMDATRDTGYYHFVLDLQELHGLITNCNGQPAVLESYLIQRWEKMASERTALLRSRFVHGDAADYEQRSLGQEG